MADRALEAWLWLARLPGVGPRTSTLIIDAYGHPEAFRAASEADRAAHGLPRAAVRAPHDAVSLQPGIDADLRWAEAGDRHLIARDDARYPTLLTRISDPPPMLYLRGDPDALNEPQVAMVGARNASENAIHIAEEFAAYLAATGLTVTSGLALGIDSAAHEGALAVQGRTVAVMATGPDRLYPRENEALADQIADNGALVTEMPTGTPVSRGLFPRRNRLIAGLSVGTLVVEAGRHSGSLETAYRAIEAGREAMAIPGSIHNPRVKGCHALIRNGARLVESARQVIEEVGHAIDGPAPSAPPADPTADPTDWTALDAREIAVLEAMDHDPIAFDTLLQRASLTPDILSSILLKLELSGDVAPCSSGYYMRTSNRAGG
ncbi:DNA-processing protein DprA [Spiribacter roseus]|uniref:DNA-processing protein DprA n=1 Tax=Spiribacter roseus TaxID=1855875 RepID=UPI00132FC9E6|nr:DNA-processing protein DprA [Spiribacter roseus]KAF0284035.1 DNA protecting protein DprA [Spiribacter roseus]